MPTYEYICKTCGDTIEVFQPFTAKPLRTHAECGGELKKVFHARGVVFKGSGFYATDSRSTASSAKSDKSHPNGSDSSKSESTKSESKTDAKPKAKTKTASSVDRD